MKIKIIFVILAIVFFALGATMATIITRKADKANFAKVEKVYVKMYDKLFAAHEELAGEARITISNTWTRTKNKKGVVVYEPTSTIEIDRLIREINQKYKYPIDSLLQSRDINIIREN